MLKIKDVVSGKLFMDMAFGSDIRDYPMVAFSKGQYKNILSSQVELNKYLKNNGLNENGVLRYVTKNSKFPGQEKFRGKFTHLLKLANFVGESRDFAVSDRDAAWLERWPNAIPVIQAYELSYPVDPKSVFDPPKAFQLNSRNKLRDLSELTTEKLKNLEILPILDLEFTKKAQEKIFASMEEISKSTEYSASRSNQISGYVYALKLERFDELLKIGRSVAPQARALELSTGAPRILKVAFAEPFQNCIDAERKIHGILENKCFDRDREWFKCSLADLKDAIQVYRAAETSV
jgi:hypothetical protein